MTGTAIWMQVFGGCVWGLIAGVLTSFGALLSFLILSCIWSQISGNKLTKALKVGVFLGLGIIFLGLGGIFAPMAIGAMVSVGILTDDSTPKIVDVTYFVFYFGTILVYLASYIRSIVSER